MRDGCALERVIASMRNLVAVPALTG